MKRLLLALLTSIVGIAMSVVANYGPFPHYPYEHWYFQDVNSPILALELSRPDKDHIELEDVVQNRPRVPGSKSADNRDAAYRMIRLNTCLDLVFIPLYASYLVILALQAGARDTLSKLIAVLAILAGLFDYVEDYFIFQTLAGHLMAIKLPSLAKWILIALTLIGIGTMLCRCSGRLYSLATDRLLGVAHIIAGLLIFAGATWGEVFGYSAIEAGLGVLDTIIALTLVYWAVDGILIRFFKSNPVTNESVCNGA